jgi:hypothetical protein
MVVPFNASIADLCSWVSSEFFYGPRAAIASDSDGFGSINFGWCSLAIEIADEIRLKDEFDAGLPAGQAWNRLPTRVGVRASRIQMNEQDRHGYDSGGYNSEGSLVNGQQEDSGGLDYTLCKFLGGFKKFVEKVEASENHKERELEHRDNFERLKAECTAEVSAKRANYTGSHRVSDYDHLRESKSVNDRLRAKWYVEDSDTHNVISMDKGHMGIVQHVAIADLLPTFDELHPPMQAILARGKNMSALNFEEPEITVDGSKTNVRYELSILRRTKFLEEEKMYPVIKKLAAGRSVPRYLF